MSPSPSSVVGPEPQQPGSSQNSDSGGYVTQTTPRTKVRTGDTNLQCTQTDTNRRGFRLDLFQTTSQRHPPLGPSGHCVPCLPSSPLFPLDHSADTRPRSEAPSLSQPVLSRNRGGLRPLRPQIPERKYEATRLWRAGSATSS